MIGHPENSAVRLLPNGTTLVNRLLRALPDEVYQALAADLRLVDVRVGDVLHKHDVCNARPVMPFTWPRNAAVDGCCKRTIG